MRFIVALDEADIGRATSAALSGRPALEGESLSIKELKSAIEALTVLKGVGTATASAIFSRFNPKIYCHMGDQGKLIPFGSVRREEKREKSKR